MDPALAGGRGQLVAAALRHLREAPHLPRQSGPAGSRLIAEVADGLPARSPDGKTYTFTIRSGFRFSPPSNQPVTAQTFKDTIERTLDPGCAAPHAPYFADIVGAGPYMAGKTRTSPASSWTATRLRSIWSHPDRDFLARIATPFFCAVPSNTPIDPQGVRVHPLGRTLLRHVLHPGPEVVLQRNPNYHGSRPHRFARIEFAVISFRRAVAT